MNDILFKTASRGLDFDYRASYFGLELARYQNRAGGRKIMAYLRSKRVKGKVYFQIVEAHREGGQKRERVLLHLGTDIVSHHSLLRWWNYLGRPRIPYVPGHPFGKGPKSLATPGETIFDLEKFLGHDRSDDQLNQVVEGLKFLMS